LIASAHCLFEGDIDFVSPSSYILLAFEWFARPPRLEEDWEAGANPALPRNCKRGHRTGPLEVFPGRPGAKSE
jgi:hypothetical protein